MTTVVIVSDCDCHNDNKNLIVMPNTGWEKRGIKFIFTYFGLEDSSCKRHDISIRRGLELGLSQKKMLQRTV